MDNYQVLQEFWEGFGISAYDEQTVFDSGNSPAYPHITYESAGGAYLNTEILTASLWARGTSWAWIKQKAEEIRKAIGYSGVILKVEGGGIWFKLPETSPFSRPLPSGEDNILRIQMNIEVDYIGGL